MKHLCFAVFFLFFLLAPTISRAETSPVGMFSFEVEAQLITGQYAKLDETAQKYRDTDATFPGGFSKLRAFYISLGLYLPPGMPPTLDGNPDGHTEMYAFQHKQAALEKWLKINPQSIAAKLGMVQLYRSYAWEARGSGSANTVNPEQWKLYKERLAQAMEYIHGLDPKTDPMIYDSYLTLIKDLSASRETMDSIYEDAIHAFPHFYDYYLIRTSSLQEKWYGKPGELAEYTQSLLKSPGGEDGDMAYAFAASTLAFQTPFQNLYTKTGLNWPSVKKAFDTKEKRYGLANIDWNVICIYALAANDVPTVKKALVHIGHDWDALVWNKKEIFDSVVAWADAQK